MTVCTIAMADNCMMLNYKIGCVRLWHLPGDKENGIILGEAEADVGYFSLGNRYMREHDLVMYVVLVVLCCAF